jgi:hypothetical protein
MLFNMSRTAQPIILSPEERKTLDAWVRGRNLTHHQVGRAKIITMAADGAFTSQSFQNCCHLNYGGDLTPFHPVPPLERHFMPHCSKCLAPTGRSIEL